MQDPSPTRHFCFCCHLVLLFFLVLPMMVARLTHTHTLLLSTFCSSTYSHPWNTLLSEAICFQAPKTEVWRLFSKFFTANILFFPSISYYFHIPKILFLSSIWTQSPKTEVWRLFSKFFGSIWELYVLGLKANIFCRKKIQLHFPMNKGLTVPKKCQ